MDVSEPARRAGTQRPTWRVWLSALLTSVLLTLVVFVPANAQDIDETRTQREANREEQARVAAELNVLNAQRSEIVAALAGLDEALAFQQGKVDAARAALVAAEATVADRQRRLEATAAEIAETRSRVTASVVDAYVGGSSGEEPGFLAAGDATEASQRTQLLDVVRGRFTDDLEKLRSLRAREEADKAAADAAAAEAVALEAALAADLEELDAQRATQARLEAALAGQIGEIQAQADTLKAAEDELTAKINNYLAEQAAAAAAAAGASASSARPKLTAASAGGFIMPVESGAVSSPFGYRRHPILGTSRLHAGTDFAAGQGEPTWATKSGTIIFAGWNGGYGNCVIIAHAGGVSSLYAHLSEIFVSEGDVVSQGETVGLVGSTGLSTGPHLHFEIRIGDEPTDPMNFL